MGFRPFHQKEHFYFITASIAGWKCLFYESQFINIILDSLNFLRQTKKHYLYSFVIMPNHIHFINKPCDKFTISEIMQNFFSYTSHKILKQLRLDNRTKLLKYFHNAALNFQARTPGRANRYNKKLNFNKNDHLNQLHSNLSLAQKNHQANPLHSDLPINHKNSQVNQFHSNLPPDNKNNHINPLRSDLPPDNKNNHVNPLRSDLPPNNKNSQINQLHSDLSLTQKNSQVNQFHSDLPPDNKNNHVNPLRSGTRPRVPKKIKHKIWQSTQAKNIYSLKVLEQKMDYIHSNPCNKKWRLANNRDDYIFSSACFYDKGIEPIIKIDNLQ